MPDRKFLQEFPLYRKFKLAFFIPNRLDEIDKPPIKMFCDNCKTDQTFAMTNEYFNEYFSRGYSNTPSHGKIVRAEYTCLHCKEFNRTFFIQIDKNLNWIMKVGQFPAWTIAGNPQIETLLGQHKEYLKRGLICESQGFGIGAFAYYRRIVEEVIDKLLDLIPRLLSGSELAQFKDALDKTKTTHVTSEKIELVKDLLPQILRPNNTN